MDFYQIRYFLTIVETENFSRASEQLFLSQPSLSTGIKKLEQELGVTLFERGGRRTILTAAGRKFLEKATVMMEQYQSAFFELKGMNEQPTLRLGVLSSLRIAILSSLISAFRSHYPYVVIELHDGTVETLRTSLENGDIDVALTLLGTNTCASNSIHDSSLNKNERPYTPLFQQPLLLATSPNHPFAKRASICLSDLDGQLFIDRINCEFREEECRILDAADIHPKVVYRASHEEGVISLVLAGLGISVMPLWFGLDGIVYLPIEDLDFQRTIGVKWRKHQSSELVQNFCHFVANHPWQEKGISTLSTIEEN